MEVSVPAKTNGALPLPLPAKQVFILAGQSNMSGRGGVRKQLWDGVVPPESAADAERIFRLGAGLEWEEAREPLHQGLDANRTCGVGPGLAFANALLKEHVGAVGLVPCAAAGTQIKQWLKGEEYYDNMVRRAKAAAAHGGEIKAVLWYQGEKDTFVEETAASYKENVEKIILDLRQDLNLPSLPVIVVALASGRDHLETVREAQKGISLPHVAHVDALGLPLEEDNLHLTTEAHVQLGLLLAHSYITHFLAQ